jgi:hypothetical protein
MIPRGFLAIYAPLTAPTWIVDRLFRILFGLGASAATLMVVGYLITHAEVVRKVVVLLLKCVVRLTGRAKKTLAAYGVADKVNSFLNVRVFAQVADVASRGIVVEWVETAQAVHEKSDGSFVVRMQHEWDSERNALVALTVAVPKLFFPHLWPHFSPRLRAAIELHIVGLMAATMSNRAWAIYSTEMAAPQTAKDPELNCLLDRLNEIQEAGFFEAILLQELIELSDRSIRRRAAGVAADVDQFVDWLQFLSVREAGDESRELSHKSKHIHVAVILASKQATAAHGTLPYRRRMKRNLLAGIRNVYLVALTHDHLGFTNEIASSIDEDGWAKRVKVADVRVGEQRDERRIIMYRGDQLRLTGKAFADLARDAGVAEGADLEGVVRLVTDDRVELRANDMDLEIRRTELAWGFKGHSGRLVAEGTQLVARVVAIDGDRCVVRASLKRRQPSPWDGGTPLTVGRTFRVEVVGVRDDGNIDVQFIDDALTSTKVYGAIRREDWSWYPPDSPLYVVPEVGARHRALLVDTDPHSDYLGLSLAAREPRDWNEAERRYPKGAKVRVTVIRVDHDGLRCELEPQVYGRIDGARLVSAGFEYADFQHTVQVGSKIDTIVIRPKSGRQFFQLDLARNAERQR